MPSLRSFRPQAILIAILLVGCSDTQPIPNSTDVVAQNNRAVGLMGQYEYAKAATLWEKLLAKHPNWVDGKVNLALAILNRQDQGDETMALSILQSASEEEPTNLRAQYLSGILLLRAGRAEDATMKFKFVLNIDPTDAYVWYQYGSALELWGQPSALRAYEKAVELDPYLRSAWYRLGQVAARQGDTERSEEALAQFEQLESNPRAVMVRPIYGRLGPKALAATLDTSSELIDPREGSVFSPPVEIAGPSELDGTPTLVDLDDDGDLDIFVPGAVFIHNNGDFTSDPAHPLAGIDSVRFALFGDADNDGGLDAYLGREGPNVLLSRNADGEWTDTTATAEVAAGDFNSTDGALVDIDHDGDLDILVANEDGPVFLFANTLDGAFRSIGEETGLATATNSTQLVIGDLDQSNDLDILALREGGENIAFMNKGLWSFQPKPGYEDVVRAVAADLKAQGKEHVIGVLKDGTLVEWQSDGPKTLRTLDALPGNLAVLDADGDGTLEIITNDNLDLSATATWAPAIFDPSAGPSVVALLDDGSLQVFPPGSGRYPFVGISLNGADDPSQQMRSNADGIGALLAARRGSTWTIQRNLRRDAGPGQSRQPLSFGLGNAKNLDFILIDWPDGLVQTELGENASGRIVETQRQASSCPVLFAFDGTEMRFQSDVLGVAGIGYLLEPGTYSDPRPHERFPMPVGSLRPDSTGRLSLVICEPMEEVCYLDAVSLVGWHLPEGWQLALDERMAIQGPQPSGEAIFYRTIIDPKSAFNDRGEDVVATITKTDSIAAPVGAFDTRFIGRLAGEHILELEFAHQLDQLGEPWLLMDGWIEYPYSQTMFASWQSGTTYDAPSLEARGKDGEWHLIQDQFGYPAGMPRTAAFPLAQLPEGTTALRLRTNQEIYWDRLRVVDAESPPAGAKRIVARVETASLEPIGYPRRLKTTQRRPDYDYSDRSPLFDFRHLRGLYTEFGAVDDLIAASDERIAIIGPGEGVTITFGRLGEEIDPATVHWILDVEGWCKDRDRFTATGKTVEPLPANAPRATRIECGR